MNTLKAPQVPMPPNRPYVLLVEDDVEDEALAQRVLKKYHIANLVLRVKDDQEAFTLLKERLSPAPAAGRSPATESARLFARARPAESSAGAGLLPAAESASRLPGPEAALQAESRVANGVAQSGGTRALGPSPELIILSYAGSKTSIPDRVRRIRSLPGMENVPLVLCCRMPEEEKAVRDAGLHRVSALSKPIGFFKLLECIQKMDMHWQVFAEKP